MATKFNSKVRGILLTSLIVFLLIALYGALHFYRYMNQTPLRIESAGYLVMVPPGLPVNKIAENLSEAGVMEHPQWFLAWLQVTGARSQVKAGEYLIKPGTTPQGLIDLLVAGKVVQHAITIVEGWTFERLMQAVNEAPKLTHTLQGLTNKEIMAKLGRNGEHPEGQFFPDTYYFPANTTDLAFLQRAYRLMQEKLNLAWENREKTLSLKSPYEVLILASIIEKESCVAEEYSEIAGVYIRRLARNMPLQADPTVIYGLGKTYTGQLTLAHLRQPSTYNTYLNVGLPPTPIALPSQRALEAATRPKLGDTLFFVATGTDRRHVFSKTEEEHQKAVLRYRAVKAQIEKERSLAAQETAVIAQEEEMVAQEKKTPKKRTLTEKETAKKIVKQAKETSAEVATPVPVVIPGRENDAQPTKIQAQTDSSSKTESNGATLQSSDIDNKNVKSKDVKKGKKNAKSKKAKKDKKNKTDKADKTDKVDKSGKTDKAGKSNKTAKTTKADKADKTEKTAKADKAKKSKKKNNKETPKKKDPKNENTSKKTNSNGN